MLGSLVEFERLFPINRNRRIRHRLFHRLIENTLTLLHVFQIDEIQYIIILLAILILDGTEFSATFVFLDEIRIESDELADFLLRHRKRNTALPADMLQYEEHVINAESGYLSMVSLQ